MKRVFAPVFAFCLLISLMTGCGGSPASEPEAQPESPSSVSPAPQESGPSAGDAEKETFVIQSVYDDYDVDGSPDPAPAEQLCRYFTDHLSSEEYLVVECWDQYVTETEETNYYVLIWAEDIERFQELLDSYDGPWVPVVFGEASYSLSDLIKAEEDIRAFMENNRELINAKIERWDQAVYVSNIMRGYGELKQFADGYAKPGLFLIEESTESVSDEAQIREYS